MSKIRPKSDLILVKNQTKIGPLPGPVQHKSDQNLDFCHEHALTPTHTRTLRPEGKVLRGGFKKKKKS